MSQLIEVPLDRLDSGENIRSAGVGDLDEMVASVSAVGIVTPVTVYQPDGSSRWMLVAGHRRVEAARRAGFDTVPALQLDAALSADDRLAVALVENLLREDIDPIDEATLVHAAAGTRLDDFQDCPTGRTRRGAHFKAVRAARVVCPAHRQGPERGTSRPVMPILLFNSPGAVPPPSS